MCPHECLSSAENIMHYPIMFPKHDIVMVGALPFNGKRCPYMTVVEKDALSSTKTWDAVLHRVSLQVRECREVS